MPQEAYERLKAAVSAEEHDLRRATRAVGVFNAIDTFSNFALPALAITGPFGKLLGVTKKGVSYGGGLLAERAVNRQTADLEAAQKELEALLEKHPELHIYSFKNIITHVIMSDELQY